MAFELSDIITKVQQRVRDTGYSTSEITNYINDTQNDVFNEYSLPFTQEEISYTLTINDPDITSGSGLPTDYVQAINLINTYAGQESVIPYVDFTTLDLDQPDVEDTTLHTTGVPRAWYYYEGEIRVFPTPDIAYTVKLKYRKRPTLLDASTDVPSIPIEFEEILVVGAAYRVLQVKDNYDQASIFQNKYDEILQKLVKRYSVRQTGAPMIMRTNRIANTPRHF